MFFKRHPDRIIRRGLWTTALLLCLIGSMIYGGCGTQASQTEILKWPAGKRGAVSLTYDGGTINQFRVALPIMNELGFPATFFIVTGEIGGSDYTQTFLGRPIEEIAQDARRSPTDSTNLFERAGAIRMLGFEGIVDYHTRAGDLFELGRFEEAYKEIDAGFSAARRGKLRRIDRKPTPSSDNRVTWDEIRDYSDQGHEFASHSVSHAQFAILDEPNLLYELERSREEIVSRLGLRHGFSVECPYGTENERVMGYTLDRYPASRNRMPEPFLLEINRWNDHAPGDADREYVQWQRGPKTATALGTMQSWIDTLSVHDNVWLVLVFHGVEGVGWEPIPAANLDAYFRYIKSKEDDLWIATFQDVTKYMRERMASTVTTTRSDGRTTVELTHSLDDKTYDHPLWLKTYLSAASDSVTVVQQGVGQPVTLERDDRGTFVRYQAVPNVGMIEIVPIR